MQKTSDVGLVKNTNKQWDKNIKWVIKTLIPKTTVWLASIPVVEGEKTKHEFLGLIQKQIAENIAYKGSFQNVGEQ